jgi:hypothetical protein
MTQEELNLVLNALNWCHGGEPCGTAEAIVVVEKALAQTQEPVATVTSETGADITMSWWHEPALPIGTKLFTYPPQRTWVGLTSDEIFDIFKKVDSMQYLEFSRAIETKLKEKNT